MSLVHKLVKQVSHQASVEEAPTGKKEKKPSLVNRLATIHQTGRDPVSPPPVNKGAPPVNKGASPVNKGASPVNKGASLVNRLASEFSRIPLPIGRVAEVRFENMESAQKAVTKLYEQTEKVLEDLNVTGQDLQSSNLELAAGKVLDMAQTVKTIKETFEGEFPHLMKFTSDTGGGEDLQQSPPADTQQPAAAPQQEESPGGGFGGGAFEAPPQQQAPATQQQGYPQQDQPQQQGQPQQQPIPSR